MLAQHRQLGGGQRTAERNDHRGQVGAVSHGMKIHIDIPYARANDKQMHMNLPEIVALDARAVRHSTDLVRRIRRIDLDRPTPCAGWTLADLLSHMTEQHLAFAAAAAGPRRAAPAPGGDLVTDYLRAADAVLAAFADSPAPEFTLPEIGTDRPLPAATAVTFHFIDYVVHAWDVAATLGTTYEPDAEMLAAALPVALAVPDGAERRAPGSPFGPARPARGRSSGCSPRWAGQPAGTRATCCPCRSPHPG